MYELSSNNEFESLQCCQSCKPMHNHPSTYTSIKSTCLFHSLTDVSLDRAQLFCERLKFFMSIDQLGHISVGPAVCHGHYGYTLI